MPEVVAEFELDDTAAADPDVEAVPAVLVDPDRPYLVYARLFFTIGMLLRKIEKCR